MAPDDRRIEELERNIDKLESKLRRFREELGEAREKRRSGAALAGEKTVDDDSRESEDDVDVNGGGGEISGKDDGAGVENDRVGDKEEGCKAITWKWPMRREEYKRYGRQLIMPEVGIGGMLIIIHFIFFGLNILSLNYVVVLSISLSAYGRSDETNEKDNCV